MTDSQRGQRESTGFGASVSGLAEVPRLETQRLILRGHRLADFEATAALWADPAVVRFITGQPSTREEAWARFLRYAGHWRVCGYGYWVAEDRQTGAFVGEIGFADYQRDIEPPLDGRPEAGWVLASSAHGRGLATEAVRCITAWADAHLHNPTTVCILQPDHAASLRVADKVGYRPSLTASYRGRETLVMERPKGGVGRA